MNFNRLANAHLSEDIDHHTTHHYHYQRGDTSFDDSTLGRYGSEISQQHNSELPGVSHNFAGVWREVKRDKYN